jgi:hypothetical protein
MPEYLEADAAPSVISQRAAPSSVGHRAAPSHVSQRAATHVISQRIEPHELSQRALGKLLFLRAWPRLLRAMRATGPTEFWIGDSHAMSVNRELTNSMFMVAPEGQIILRAGPRLMASIAAKGFPTRVERLAGLVHRCGRRGAFVPIFSAGEIDMRAHLAKRPDDDFSWVATYVARCADMAAKLRGTRFGIMVPAPPVDVADETIWFPVVGSFGERLAIHGRLRRALATAVAATPHGVLIDCTEALTGPDGGMPLQYTVDGVHTNARAIAIVRAELRRIDWSAAQLSAAGGP